MCRCLWYARGLCLCPCVITPRGFTSLPTQEEYSFSGFYSNKQTESARRLKPLLVSFKIDVTFYNFGRIVWLTFRINFRIPNWTASKSGTGTKIVPVRSLQRERKRFLLYNSSMIVLKKSFVERNWANMKRGWRSKPRILRIPPGKVFSRQTLNSILLRENWVSEISPIIWGSTVSKCTHRLQKEVNNLGRSLCCASWGCYPRISGTGSNLIKKVPMTERLPWPVSTIEHR